MQQEISEQLLTNYIQRTPIRNVFDKTITWAPRKERCSSGNTGKFCRRCSPSGKECECSETHERNAQRCLNFFDKEEAEATEVNMEFTPYSSRSFNHGAKNSKIEENSVDNTKKIRDSNLLPQLNSKRKLIYAKAMQN